MTNKNFSMPQWMECTWRRVPCGSVKCKVCSRLAYNKELDIVNGEDSDDSFESFLDGAHMSFKEALYTFLELGETFQGGQVAEASESFASLPQPETIPLYRKLKQWYTRVSAVVRVADENEEVWLHTEAGKDLIWYQHTILSKTYRQLLNRQETNLERSYVKEDVRYTAYVLGECIDLIKDGLIEIYKLATINKVEVLMLLDRLEYLEPEIRNI